MSDASNKSCPPTGEVLLNLDKDLMTYALASLSIRNFRGIDSLDLDFRGPDGLPNRLIVIGGPNGCGKTAVLEAALILMGGASLATGLVGKKAIRRGADDFSLEGIAEDPTGGGGKVSCLINSSLSLAVNYPVSISYFPSSRSSWLGGPVDVSLGHFEPSSQETSRDRLLTVKRRLVNAAAAERFAEGGSQPINYYSRLIRSINQAWSEFDSTDGVSFAVELADRDEPQRGSFDLFYRRPGHPRLEVDLLSSGQQELLLFFADLVPDQVRGGIVFIDEPELHLDPQWHRPFLRSLMRLQPNSQFIVTTHSTEIFDAARSYEQHFLVPETDPRARLWPEKRISSVGV